MTIIEQSNNKEEERAGSIELFKTEDEPGKMSIREEDDDVEKAISTNNNNNREEAERTSSTMTTSASSGGEQQSNNNSTSTTNNIVNNNRFPFPQAFYDPVTKMIMLDPVVHPDGVSHEKNEDTDVKCYPNRAMKALIEQELDRYSDEGSVRAMVQDLGDNLRSGWNKLMERSALPAASTGGEDRILPEPFYCPISFELIHQPVIDPDGHTYEKAAIEHWIRANGDSPVTRQTMTVDELRENKAFFSVLTELAEGDDETMHPSIRKWKEDHSNLQFLTIVPLGGSTDDGIHPNGGGDGTHQGGGGAQFPITQAELDERRRQRRQNNCTTFGILLACLIVFLFFPSYFFLFTIIIACAWFLHEPYRNRQQQLRRAAIRQAAIQDLQREQQQREEQQRIQRQQQQQLEQQLQLQQQGLSSTTENP